MVWALIEFKQVSIIFFQKIYFRVRASLKTGTLFSNDSKLEDEFWYETYRVNTLWYHEMHKCITLQWPEFTNRENAGVSAQFL